MKTDRRLITVGVFLIVGLLFWYLLAPSMTVHNYPSRGKDIVAFGDSLVYGLGSNAGNDFVSQLSLRIGQPIVNLGVPGNTTQDALARLHEIDRYDPKVVIILLGGNDYLRRIPQEDTKANLAKIIEYAQGRGAIVLLLGVRGGILQDHFDDMYKDLRDEYRTAYVSDVLSGLIADKKYMYDQVHPNDLGYRFIADRVQPVLMTLLK